MKLLFVWVVGYYCVDLNCYQLHQPVNSIAECETTIMSHAQAFSELDEEYGGKWELDCHVMINKYVGQS